MSFLESSSSDFPGRDRFNIGEMSMRIRGGKVEEFGDERVGRRDGWRTEVPL